MNKVVMALVLSGLGAVSNVVQSEVTSVDLDQKQAAINKLNNRSIELLNNHALVRYVIDKQIYAVGRTDNSSPGIYELAESYLSNFGELISKADSLYNEVNSKADTLYLDGDYENIKELLAEFSLDYSKLMNERDVLLGLLVSANENLSQVPVFPGDYLGENYRANVEGFNKYKLDTGNEINNYINVIASSSDAQELGSLISKVDSAIEELFKREALKATELRNTLNNVLTDIKARSDIEPKLDDFSSLKFEIENASSHGYWYLAHEKFDQITEQKSLFEEWLNTLSASENLKLSTLARLSSSYELAKGVVESMPSSADSTYNLFVEIKEDYLPLCQNSSSFRNDYDCQILRPYEGFPAFEVYNLDSNLYPVLEKQLRKFKEGL